MMLSKRNQKGIALIQVLVISAIISTLALYLNYTAKVQVHIAQQLKDKNQALLNLYSTEAQTLFALYTNPLRQSKGKNSLSDHWNFYGQPFLVNDNAVSLQDNAGLLYMSVPDPKIFKELLRQRGQTEEAANIAYDSLVDWQDGDDLRRINGAEADYYVNKGYKPRNQSMILPSELSFVRGFDAELAQQLSGVLTQFRPSFFNPLNAPKTVIEAAYTQREEILAKRERGDIILADEFKRITGEQESESVFFLTSQMLTLKIISKVNEARVVKTQQIRINPYAKYDTPSLYTYVVAWH